VRHHHERHLRQQRPEGRQLDAIEPRPVVLHDRQRQVRIDIGIAVPGEMLRARQHAGIAQP
jgi:hypothetical protein